VLALLVVGFIPYASGASPDLGCAPVPTPADLRRYQGVWVRIESTEERRALFAAIERAVMTIPRLLRALARTAMRREIKPPQRYEFVLEGDALWLAADGRAPSPLPLDGEPHEGSDLDGKPLVLCSRLAGGALETRWQREDSRGSNLYRLSDDGERLVVVQTIESEHFEGPVAYRATFRRTEPESTPRRSHLHPQTERP
jgi:hypothetical protein